MRAGSAACSETLPLNASNVQGEVQMRSVGLDTDTKAFFTADTIIIAVPASQDAQFDSPHPA